MSYSSVIIGNPPTPFYSLIPGYMGLLQNIDWGGRVFNSVLDKEWCIPSCIPLIRYFQVSLRINVSSQIGDDKFLETLEILVPNHSNKTTSNSSL